MSEIEALLRAISKLEGYIVCLWIILILYIGYSKHEILERLDNNQEKSDE
jgi:hypothetical protein